ncbi:hypothetical protein U1Q18_005611 [Sarracenia purpurea var. burkii]
MKLTKYQNSIYILRNQSEHAPVPSFVFGWIDERDMHGWDSIDGEVRTELLGQQREGDEGGGLIDQIKWRFPSRSRTRQPEKLEKTEMERIRTVRSGNFGAPPVVFSGTRSGLFDGKRRDPLIFGEVASDPRLWHFSGPLATRSGLRRTLRGSSAVIVRDP